MSPTIFFSDEQKLQAENRKKGPQQKVKAVKATKTTSTKTTQPRTNAKPVIQIKASNNVAQRSSPRLAATSQGKAAKTPNDRLQHAIQTARVIANSKGHFNHEEVKALLLSLEKGWINGERFQQLLPPLLFQ